MTLNHSKTWPVSTMAVVQLRVDPDGRTYKTLEDDKQPLNNPRETEKRNQNIEPKYSSKMTSHPHLKHTVRTDTVSTILEQELDSENNEIPQENSDKKYEKFHVLALTRIEENEPIDRASILNRRQSSKVDNWDLIYTEANRLKCSNHCNEKACKVKSLPPCQEHKNCRLPEVPLDARKTYTLRKHYYPEGGWGWIIIVCSVLVHVLNQGLQLSSSQIVVPGAQKFKTDAVHVAGELIGFVVQK